MYVSFSCSVVTLSVSPDTCDLHFQVSSRGSRGQPRFIEQFPFLWSGCRLTYGAHQGRVGFEVRFERKLLAPWKEADPEPHGLRVGWSVDNSSLQLGKALGLGFTISEAAGW